MIFVDLITILLSCIVLRLLITPPHDYLYMIACAVLGIGMGIYRGIKNAKNGGFGE